MIKLDRKEFNKSVQVFALAAKLHSLVMGCYVWSRKAKGFIPTKDFSEKFDVVIKTSQQLKRHDPEKLFARRLLDLKFKVEEKNA